MTRLSFFCASFVAALVTLLCCVLPSHAQMGLQAGFVEAFQPDYLKRDMTLFVDYLGLEEWQQPTVESLLGDYTSDFTVGVDGLRDRMKGLKDQILGAGEQGAIAVIMKPIGEWSHEKARLKQRFIDNLRSVLSDEQQGHWPQLERAMRREKELPRGVLSGESIDLRQVSRDCEIPPETLLAAKEALEQYEIGLDAALIARATQMATSQDKIKDAMVAQDFATGLDQLEMIVAKRVALRDLQEQSIELLAVAYGAQWGSTFRTRAFTAAYPSVFRPSPMIPLVAAARELPGLSPGQIDQLNVLEVAYVVSYHDLELRLAAAHRVEEPRKQSEETRRRMNQGSSNAVKPNLDPYKSLHEERDALNEKFRADIAAIVGPELALLLPGAAKIASDAMRPMIPGKPERDSPTLNSGTAPTSGDGKGGKRPISRQGDGRDSGPAGGIPRGIE
ncbi:MAG: hypothetical protein EXS17_01415 [Phycisphaerales bacterium]|nr:hypothetical protein [Phycisphaerales bacterium]